MDIMEEGGGIMMRWGREVVIAGGRAVWCVSLKGGRNFVFVSCAGLSLAGDWPNFAWPSTLANFEHQSRSTLSLSAAQLPKRSAHREKVISRQNGATIGSAIVVSWGSNFRNHCIAIARRREYVSEII